MEEMWYSSIARLICVIVAILLYGVALFSIFKRSRKPKVSAPEEPGSTSLEYNGAERRIYPRAKINVLVRYKIYGKGKELHIFKEGRAVDISEGGIGILLETHEKLNINDKLELKLKLPIASQFSLIRGDVVWARELEKEKWYRYGVTFTDIDPNDKKVISRYVSEFPPADLPSRANLSPGNSLNSSGDKPPAVV